MSDYNSDDDHELEMGNLYQKEDGSEISEEHNHTSVRSPGIETQMSSGALSGRDLDFSSKLKHSSPIGAVALYVPKDENSPPLIITGSDDDKAVVWDLRSGKKLRSLKGEHSDRITSVCVFVPPSTPNAPKVLTGSWDHSIIVWDLMTGDKELTVTDDSSEGINAVAVCIPAGPDPSPLIVGGCENGAVQMWDMRTGVLVRTLTDLHDASITSIAVYTFIIVTGSEDSTAVISNVNGKKIATLSGHEDTVTSLALYTPTEGDVNFDQPLVITGSEDQKAMVWGFNTGEIIRVLDGAHEDTISAVSVVMSRDGGLPIVVTCSHDSTAVLWDLLSGRVLRRLEGGHTDYINAVVVYVPDDNKQPTRVITAGEDCVVMIWELSKGDQIKSKKAYPIDSRGFMTKLETQDSTHELAVYVPADGSSPPLFVVVGQSETVHVWNLATAKEVMTLEEDGHTDWVRSVAVFTPPEHSTLPPMTITGCDDGTAIVWDLHTGKKIHHLQEAHESDISSIAVYAPPEGEYFPAVVVTASSDKTATIWNLQTGENMNTLKGEHTDYINCVEVFLPQRTSPSAPFCPLILTGSDDETVIVWELKTGKRVRTIKFESDGSEMNCMTTYEPFDHSAQPIVITGNENSTVNLWDLNTGEHLRTLGGGHGDGVNAVCVYTPQDRNSLPFIVSGSYDYTAVVWDLMSGTILRTLSGGHNDAIYSVGIYAPPDGSHVPFIITAGEDYHITLWDLNAQQMQRCIEGGHADGVSAVAVYAPNSPDAPALAITGSEDSTIIVWELKSGKKVKVLADGHSDGIRALAVYNPPADENATPLLISTSADQSTIVWNLLTLKKLKTLKGHTAEVNALAIYTQGGMLITGSNDFTANVWNLRSGKNVRTLKEHQEPVTALAVYAPQAEDKSPWVFTGSADKITVVNELNTGKRIGALAKDGHTDKVTAIVVHSTADDNGRPTILTSGGGEDQSIIIWSSLPFLAVRRIGSEAPINAMGLFIPPDNPLSPEVVASGTHGCLWVWELKSGEKIRTMESSEAHAGSIMSLAIYAPTTGASPALVVTGGDDVTAMIWNYKSGNRLHALEGGHGQDINCLAVYKPMDPSTPALLITASDDQVCIVWDVKSGRKVGALEGLDERITCLAVYAPTEDTEAVLSDPLVIAGGAKTELCVWELHSGSKQDPFTGLSEGEEATALSLFHLKEETGTIPMLACAHMKSVIVWTVSDRKQLRTIATTHTAYITCMTVLAGEDKNDDTLVITGSYDTMIEIWNLKTAAFVRKLTTPNDVICMAAYKANVGPMVLCGSYDGLLQLWNVSKGEVQFTLKGKQTKRITSVSVISVDDTPIGVAGGTDTLISVWDLMTGREIRTMEGAHAVTALCLYEPLDANTSSLIFSATEGRVVDVWADCLILSDYMPLPSMVSSVLEFEIAKIRALDQDCAWTRIADIAREFGDTFWLENYHLFTTIFERIALKPSIRDSFFRTFKANLPLVIHVLPEVLLKDKGKKKSILEVCIEDNLAIRGIILDAWIAALNSPNVDFVRQMYHPGTFFPTHVLIGLGERFPAEFIDFVCRIKLIKSHPLLHLRCPAYDIDHKSGLIIEGLPAKPAVNVWTTIAGYCASRSGNKDAGKINQPVTAFVLPLVGAADMKMLNTYVDISNTTDNLAIFESDVGVTAFKYAWASFGLRIHMTTTIRYTCFIAIYTVSVFTFDRLQRADHLSTWFWAWFLQALVLLCVIYYICDETRQFWNENKDRILELKQRVIDVRKRLLDSRERAKELKKAALKADGQAALEEEESKYKPGQHRRHFTLTGPQVVVTQRVNPNRYTGVRYLLATLHLKLLDAKDAVVHGIAGAVRDVVTGWDNSIIKLVFLHFAGFWNLIDLSVISIVTVGTIARIWNGHETVSSRCILSVGSVLVWFKVLNFMRPFKHSGPLIAMILQIMKDIQYFVFILGVVLTGFSMAFWLISYTGEAGLPKSASGDLLPFGSIEMAFLNTYLYMLGQNISVDFGDTASPQLGIVLLVMFMFFMMILMLNLLIALMGNSYSKVQEKGLAEWRLGQASMILEQAYMMSRTLKRAHERFNVIHVMKYTSLLPNEDREVEVTDGQLAALKGQLEGRLAALEKKIDETSQK